MHAFVHTLGINTVITFYFETVGTFGWRTVPLRPLVVYLLPLVSLLIVGSFGIRGTVERSVSHALWCLALAFASVNLVFLALYLMYTPTGQDNVVGVQGRYFLPILAFAGIAVLELIPVRKRSAPKWFSLVSIAGLAIVQMVAMDTTIIRTFHVF